MKNIIFISLLLSVGNCLASETINLQFADETILITRKAFMFSSWATHAIGIDFYLTSMSEMTKIEISGMIQDGQYNFVGNEGIQNVRIQANGGYEIMNGELTKELEQENLGSFFYFVQQAWMCAKKVPSCDLVGENQELRNFKEVIMSLKQLLASSTIKSKADLLS